MRRLVVIAVLAGCCAAIAAERRPTYTLTPVPFNPFALTPSQVFDKVKDSVLVVRTFDANGKIVGQGSGVILPAGMIGTNCHVLKNGMRFQVGRGKRFVSATLWGSDEDKDICLLEASGITGKAAELGRATRLNVGDPVYAVGAPQGLELSLSNGIVSQLRGGPPPFIQTTAAISPGSSGGGLFDEEGRLVGFTTLYIEGGQSLNFATPVEWVSEIRPATKAAEGRRAIEWKRGALALHPRVGDSMINFNWNPLRDWSKQWTQAEPGNSDAWKELGYASKWLWRYTEAMDAYRQALRINPDDAETSYSIGALYTIRKRYTEAIDAYRQAVRVDPKHTHAWHDLAIIYNRVGNRAAALEAVQQLRRVDPIRGKSLFENLTTATPKSGPITLDELLFSD